MYYHKNCFCYLLIFYFEKLSTSILRLPFAVYTWSSNSPLMPITRPYSQWNLKVTCKQQNRSFVSNKYISQAVYLTIIPRARMGCWLRGHEGERNNCFSKVGKKYRDKTTLALALATLVAIVLVFKAGAFR